MELQCNDAIGGRLAPLAVNHVRHHRAVDLEDDLRAACDDRVLVPIVRFDVLLQFRRIGELRDVAAAVFMDHHFLAALRHDFALVALVEDSRVIRPGFHVGLIALDIPVGQPLATEVDARIAPRTYEAE